MNVFSNQLIAEKYDKFYETIQGKAIDNIEKEIILRHIDGITGGYLLELGCGTGHWTEFFCGQGFKVTAIDESEAMLSIAENKKIKNATFIKADAKNLPFTDQCFSAVISVTMLEFVEDIKRLMDEIDRILIPGGRLVLGCLNDLSELGKNKYQDEVYKHARFFTPAEIENLLSHFGTPHMSYGVYYSPEFELLDGTESQDSVEPAFIAASVKKIN